LYKEGLCTSNTLTTPNLDRAGLYSRMKAEIVELARAKDE